MLFMHRYIFYSLKDYSELCNMKISNKIFWSNWNNANFILSTFLFIIAVKNDLYILEREVRIELLVHAIVHTGWLCRGGNWFACQPLHSMLSFYFFPKCFTLKYIGKIKNCFFSWTVQFLLTNFLPCGHCICEIALKCKRFSCFQFN